MSHPLLPAGTTQTATRGSDQNMSTPTHDSVDVVTAALLQITQQAERLAVLDQREAAHYQEIAARLAELTLQLTETGDRVEGVHNLVARQAALLETLDGLDQQVSSLATQLTSMMAAGSRDEDGEPYRPVPAPRWWKLVGAERDQALARLCAWVEQVYRPGYGHLAAALGPCWEHHALCLYGLDWLMELWSALYLPPGRRAPSLASQAEWQTRLLPALAEQMYIETTRCQHAKTTLSHRQAPPPSEPQTRAPQPRQAAPKCDEAEDLPLRNSGVSQPWPNSRAHPAADTWRPQ
jgi:hypothetical protein